MKPALIRKSALIFAAALIAGSAFAQTRIASDGTPLDVQWVPTPHEVVKRMLEIAKVGPEDVHFDLGSGDGRIAIAAVKDFNAKKAVGIDLDPQRIQESNDNKAKAGVGDKVQFLHQNIFKADLQEATVVSMYLLPSINDNLRPKLMKELKPGTRVVTHAFNITGWQYEHQESVDGYQVYFFTVPADLSGKWELSQGERKMSLDLKSEYTELSGTVTANGKSAPLSNGRISGTKVEFTLDIDGKPVKYEGKADAGTITGNGWTAKKS